MSDSESAHPAHLYTDAGYIYMHVEGTATGRFIKSCVASAYDQNSKNLIHHILGETRDSNTCMSPVDVLCLILRMWRSLIQRLGLDYSIGLGLAYEFATETWLNCRDNEHHEQVETAC